MPNTASAKKRLRQDEVRRARNRAMKSSVKTQIKRILQSVADGKLAQAEQEFRTAAKGLDRAAARNVLHRNTVARQKSRLQRLIMKAKRAG
jgi:small subunit ribosomal protein S20